MNFSPRPLSNELQRGSHVNACTCTLPRISNTLKYPPLCFLDEPPCESWISKRNPIKISIFVFDDGILHTFREFSSTQKPVCYIPLCDTHDSKPKLMALAMYLRLPVMMQVGLN